MGVRKLGHPCEFTPPLTPPRQGEGNQVARASWFTLHPLWRTEALQLRGRGGAHGTTGAEPRRPPCHSPDRMRAVGAARHGALASGARHPGRARAAVRHRRRDADHSGLARRVRLGGRARRRSAGRHQCRHAPRVRLPGRRPDALRQRAAGDQLHPRLPGAAPDPGDQRALPPPLSLGPAAGDRARRRLGAAALLRRHRPRGHVGRRQHFRRHGRGARC